MRVVIGIRGGVLSMAFLSSRKSSGKTYWSICESRRIEEKPRNIPIEYLGTAETLLKRLSDEDDCSIKPMFTSWSRLN